MRPQTIQRVLCPTDFSPFSARAFDYALVLARFYAAEVEVLYVSPLMVHMPGDITYTAAIVRLDEKTRRALTKELDTFAEPARRAAVPVRVRVIEGDPSTQILGRAKSAPMDLIVMGTHGHRGLDRWLLGSVAEKVLVKSGCPVLTVTRVSEDGAGPQPPLIERILCPLDPSDSSVTTLGYAFSLARKTKATVTVLHVVEGMLDRNAPAEVAPREPLRSEYRRQIEADVRRKLDDVFRATGEPAARTERIVVGGRDYKEILRVSKEHRSDLIVMGVHGRRTSGMAPFGSTARHVVREASCPVLTIRTGD